MRKFALFLLLAGFAYAQNTDQDPLCSSISFNLGGQASLVSCEFEYLLPGKDDMNHWSLSAGIGNLLANFSFPVGFIYSYGRDQRMITGIQFLPAVTFAMTPSPTVLMYAISPRFGYKKINRKEGRTTFSQIYYSPSIFIFNGPSILQGAALGWGIYF